WRRHVLVRHQRRRRARARGDGKHGPADDPPHSLEDPTARVARPFPADLSLVEGPGSSGRGRADRSKKSVSHGRLTLATRPPCITVSYMRRSFRLALGVLASVAVVLPGCGSSSDDADSAEGAISVGGPIIDAIAHQLT